MKSMIGYSLFPIQGSFHGAHIRPLSLCRELGIPLFFQESSHIVPRSALSALVRNETFFIFPGYTADQLDLLLAYLSKLRGCQILLDVADIPYLQYSYFIGVPSAKSQADFGTLLKLAHALLFPTTSLKQIADSIFDISEKPSYIIGNGSDPNHFHFKALPEKKVALYVGGYIPARGIDELLLAFNILRNRKVDCQLRLVSNGFPENIVMEGLEVWRSLYYDMITPMFENCYAFVIPHRPNRYMRASAPLKLFDAMAAGRPIVSTDCLETSRIIEEERCGIVTRDDPGSIADAILYLFENREESAKMGWRGRIAVEKRYSWKQRAHELREVLSGK